MRRSKLLIAILGVLVLALDSAHATTAGPPYDSATHEDGCETFGNPLNSCTASSSADAATGDIAGAASLRTGLGAPSTSMWGHGEGRFLQSIANATPVTALRVTAVLHVDDATAHLAQPAWATWSPETPRNWAATDVLFGLADASGRCSMRCSDPFRLRTIAEQITSGDVHVTNQDVTLTATFYRCDGTSLPAGSLTAAVWLGAQAYLGSLATTGSEASVSMSGTLTSISYEEVVAGPAC